MQESRSRETRGTHCIHFSIFFFILFADMTLLSPPFNVFPFLPLFLCFYVHSGDAASLPSLPFIIPGLRVVIFASCYRYSFLSSAARLMILFSCFPISLWSSQTLSPFCSPALCFSISLWSSQTRSLLLLCPYSASFIYTYTFLISW